MGAMYRRTDTELVLAYASTQNERTSQELVVRHRQIVYRTCLRILGDSHETQDATNIPAKAGHSANQGSVKVDVEVAKTKVPLSVMKAADDYFIVCPPCSARVSCEKLAEGKGSAKMVVRKGETAFYTCCPLCLSEIDRNSARYAKLLDAGLKTAPQLGQWDTPAEEAGRGSPRAPSGPWDIRTW